MAFWFSPLAFRWRNLTRVCVCFSLHMCVCVCFGGAVCRRWGGRQELWCKCPHSHWLLMNGSCCDDDDGETGVGGLSYALQSSEWLEFNTVKKTRERSGKQSGLFMISIYFLGFHFFKSFWNKLQVLCKCNVEYRCYWFNSGSNKFINIIYKNINYTK